MGKSSSGKDTVYQTILEKYGSLRTIVPYTTRPAREGEKDGVEYFFVTVDEYRDMEENGQIIEARSYNTKCGIWTYFTAADGQIDLKKYNYVIIGTLVSYRALVEYFGEEYLVPVYIEVEDGERLSRALEREKHQQLPKYAEVCRRFLADAEDFSEENLRRAGIKKRFVNSDLKKCLDDIEKFMGL